MAILEIYILKKTKVKQQNLCLCSVQYYVEYTTWINFMLNLILWIAHMLNQPYAVSNTIGHTQLELASCFVQYYESHT